MLHAILACAIAASLSLVAVAAPPTAPYQQALHDFQSGEYQNASATLEATSQHNVGSELLLARCYEELGDWNLAVSHAEAAIHLDRSNSDAHLLLGEAFGRKAESERSLTLAVKARRQFERAVALAPANIDARRDLLQYYLDAPWVLGGGKDKARDEARAIASLSPVQGALASARVDEQSGSTEEARQEYGRVLALKPRDVGPCLESADFYVKTRDITGLNEAIRGAETINAGDVRLAYYRGVARVLEGQRLGQAEHDLKSYVSDTPNRRDYPSRASALSWLGRLYERPGEAQPRNHRVRSRFAARSRHTPRPTSPRSAEAGTRQVISPARASTAPNP